MYVCTIDILIFVCFFFVVVIVEVISYYVAHLPETHDLPATTSLPSVKNTGVHHHSQLNEFFLMLGLFDFVK